jgi:uncharacterized membrane protein YqhA
MMRNYKLFINKIDPANEAINSRPSWLQINSINDMKTSLSKVILMLLIVPLFEHSLQIHYKRIKDLLFLSIGILLISEALYLKYIDGKHGHKHGK